MNARSSTKTRNSAAGESAPSRRPRFLLAGTEFGLRPVAGLLAELSEVVYATTLEEAVARAAKGDLDGVVIGYHFDEFRPYRIVQQLKSSAATAELPTLLVRSLPVRLGETSEDQIREAYLAIGVDEFLSLHDVEQQQGRAAAREIFVQALTRLLKRSAGRRTQR